MTTPSSASVPWATAGPARPGNSGSGNSGSGNGSASGPEQTGHTLWARQTPSAGERVTARARRLVEGLPDWDPLPPGESLVKRPRA
jgi:hypothetical protein